MIRLAIVLIELTNRYNYKIVQLLCNINTMNDSLRKSRIKDVCLI